MQITINIPKDFELDYRADKFYDFFSRVLADIDMKGLCGNYEKETAEMLLDAFKSSAEKKVENKKKDIYGNNINFSSDIMSNMSLKGLLGKWTELLASNVKYALAIYYGRNEDDAGYKNITYTKPLFMSVHDSIRHLTPVLEDMVQKNIVGIEDIFTTVFGVGSDEVYLLRKFNEEYSDINEWTAESIREVHTNDKRLIQILELNR